MHATKQTRQLIVNADGYGFTPGVNAGIVRAFETGLVRSTSCTPNFGFLDEVGEIASRFPEVSFGIHYNISVGFPVSPPGEVPSLIGSDGRFHSVGLLGKLLRREIRREELVRELTAQAALLADAGIRITHFDGHQNKHLYPMYFEAALEVSRKFGIRAVRTHRRLLYTFRGPIKATGAMRYYLTHPTRLATHIAGRVRTQMAGLQGFASADRLITPGYADATHKTLREFWEVLARTLPGGVSEVYCHPAVPDELLRANARYVDERAEELRVLTDPSLKQLYDEMGIEVISFQELVGTRR